MIIWLSEGSMHWGTWAVHRGLDTWTEEQRKWVTREGNYWNEGKIRRDAYLVKTWLETKQNKPVKLTETPKLSAYRYSLSGNGRYIFPANISERQFNFWSSSEFQQNTTKYPNLKIKKKFLWNSELSPSPVLIGWSLNWALHKRKNSTETFDKQDVSVHFLPQDVSFHNWRKRREFGRDLLNE